jgi:predicted membrane chloride channel (bestrophin family)
MGTVGAPVASILIAYALFGLDEVGSEVEIPFEE